MEEALRETLESDDALGDAAAVVLDRAESGDGTLAWVDVSDAVPAEQWGRLLEREVVVATEGVRRRRSGRSAGGRDPSEVTIDGEAATDEGTDGGRPPTGSRASPRWD